MTLEEIRNTILSSPTLKEMAIKGDDGKIAIAISKGNTSPKLTLSELMSKLSSASMAKLVDNSPALLDFRDMITRQDFQGLFFWVSVFQKAGDITTSEMNNINAELNRCLPNTITVTVEEINKALKNVRKEGKTGNKNWIGG